MKTSIRYAKENDKEKSERRKEREREVEGENDLVYNITWKS
jgi:hypothetical protein